ncbi:phage tail tape measure protein, TP901 family, core region [Humidesulfovibrio mexicanus]|uniref:Phage tail tape measure protein, TP901 family, core region n=1 Tax=Humidesulfovibrio mexicanus TaxID=147047 RepID=A0A238XLV6_9BACT|nr:phage tail tape measure protein [Humidesulfovibrio mexicanus]SNR59571.1 phage tail tape measure protein, TP901 family, core region [Humidesulfovibrio mexicanus]
MAAMKASIILDLGGNLAAQARRNEAALGGLARSGQRDMGLLSRSAQAAGRGLDALGNRYTAALAGAGAAYKSARAVMDSAQLDKSLIRVTQTAGATRQAAAALRRELLEMAKETGQSVDDLLVGFNALVASGMEWDKALATIGPINKAMAVTGANAKVLSDGLTVAAEAFQFDLSKPDLAARMLDKMTVAGRLGKVELENLSGVFAGIGQNAKAAGMSFEQTLGFAEKLSIIEQNPDRLRTLADSTLRLFTNLNYQKKASQATGVSFYNAKGERRAAIDVLEDISAKYKKATTDAQRDRFIDAAFGDADLDTKKGLGSLLKGDALAEMRVMIGKIEQASGAIAKDLPDALANSVDQVARLKAALRQAADGFAKPVNETIQNAIKHLLDERKLSGEQLLAGGAAAAGIGFGLVKGGGKLLQKVGGMGAGVATGKALQEFAGVTPVYVVNMPAGGLGAGGNAANIGDAVAKGGGKYAKLGTAAKYAGRIGMAVAVADTGYELYKAWTGDGTTGEKVKATTKGVGGLGGAWLGAKAGAAAGAGIGSLFAGVGAAPGAAIGGLLGGIGGFFAGRLGGEALGEKLTAEDIGNAVGRSVSEKEARLRIDVTGPGTVRDLHAKGFEPDVYTGLYMY